MSISSSAHAFTWSHTRDQIFSDCRRRYYWQYYASHAGLSEDAEDDKKRARMLKQLVTLPMALGTVVHTCARGIAAAIRDGREPPSAAELHRWVRTELNRLWLASRNRTLLHRAQADSPLLREIYYRDRLLPRAIAGIRQRMMTCLAHLVTCSVWAELRGCGTDDFLLLESPLRAQIDDLIVHAVPDLVYRRDKDTGVIVDFKTGGRRRGIMDQLALYALCLSRTEGTRGITDWRGKICFLADGVESEYRLTPKHLDRALNRITASVAQMRQYLSDPEQNVPKKKEDFPVTEAREQCFQCPYLELCAAELGINGISGPERTSR